MLVFFQNEDMQQQIIKETFQLVSKRDDNVCNFLEGGRLVISGVGRFWGGGVRAQGLDYRIFNTF